MAKKIASLSNHISHLFHQVSNVRPLVWIGLYIVLIPVFAFVYWALPDSQFRVPDGGGLDYGSCLYYSIVTISTLGFGDYTPAHAGAQAVTAIEVMCGLVVLGFFLNAVGSMKSEIDVESEIEKQKHLHLAAETEKLRQSTPLLLHLLHAFATDVRSDNPSKSNNHQIMHAASRAALALDSFQNRVDLTLWPQLLEDCFAFVANYQILESDFAHGMSSHSDIDAFAQRNAALADNIDLLLTRISTSE